MIGPEAIKPVIDPVPISIRLAIKMKDQQRMPLQSKNWSNNQINSIMIFYSILYKFKCK